MADRGDAPSPVVVDRGAAADDEKAAAYGPVTDWAKDLDHADPAYNRYAHQIWRPGRRWLPGRPLRSLWRHVGPAHP
jgi:hypothetical protein